MKRFLVSLWLIFLVGCSSGPGINDLKGDFRNANWGDGLSTVMKSEYYDLEAADGNLYCSGQLDGADCDIEYFFEEGKLVGGKYTFIKDYENSKAFIDAILELRKRMTAVYGEAESQSYPPEEGETPEEFRNKLLTKIRPTGFGWESRWKTNRNDILVSCRILGGPTTGGGIASFLMTYKPIGN